MADNDANQQATNQQANQQATSQQATNQQPADADADADAPKLTEREVEINGTKTTLQLNEDDMKRYDEQEQAAKAAAPVRNKARR